MRIMKYYVDDAGAYLGGSDSTQLSSNEVSNAPNDASEIWDGNQWNSPEPTRQQYIDLVAATLQAEMDKDAQSLGYDTVVTAITYAEEPLVPQFQVDGQSFRAWRSAVWAYAYETLAAYEASLLAYPDLMTQYETNSSQYDLDLAQYEIDIVAEPPLDPAPVEPVFPVAPSEVVTPTIEDIVAGMPVRL